LRRLLFKEKHPLEKLKRIGLGPMTVEGIPRGRYRMLQEKEAEALKKVASDEWRKRKDNAEGTPTRSG
jgi:16S rRNA U516 pseudouridylate synthase RsuA-like enzyme